MSQSTSYVPSPLALSIARILQRKSAEENSLETTLIDLEMSGLLLAKMFRRHKEALFIEAILKIGRDKDGEEPQ